MRPGGLQAKEAKDPLDQSRGNRIDRQTLGLSIFAVNRLAAATRLNVIDIDEEIICKEVVVGEDVFISSHHILICELVAQQNRPVKSGRKIVWSSRVIIIVEKIGG